MRQIASLPEAMPQPGQHTGPGGVTSVTTPYVSTFLGNRFYPLEPRIDRIVIEDIAHGLAYQCRFNGQTQTFYSVAQHSLIVSSLVPTDLRLAALLHDAAEAYLGDMVKPLKVLLPEFALIEDQVSSLIAAAFGVDFSDYAPIKRADLIALATEKRDLMPHSAERWSYLDGICPLPQPIVPMSPGEAKQAFLREFMRLDRVARPGRAPEPVRSNVGLEPSPSHASMSQ